MLQLYDISHNKLCALTDDKLKDYYSEQAVNILDHLYFSYPILDANFALIQQEGFVCTQDNEYVIKEINLQGSDTGIEYAQIVADINIEDIQGTRVDNFDTEEQLCTDAANLALAGTGWSVGTCDVTALRTTKKTQCSAYDVLQEIQKTYNCEMVYDAVSKHVNIYQQGGTDKGTYFSEQLNLKQLSAQGSSRDYITCLIPIGKDGLDITSVNPTGLDYIVNHQYSSKNIYAYWSDNNYTAVQDLYDDAVARLNYMSVPVIAYSVAIIDLANVSGVYSSLDYDLGDSITLLSASKSIRIQERIVKINRYPLEPERSTCEIANRIASLDALNVRFDDTSDTVDNVTTSDGMVDGSKVSCLPNANLGIVTTQNLTSVLATIGTAIITKLDATDLTAINASISSLTANKANVTDLTAATGRIGTLEVHSESVDTLLAGNIGAANLAAGAIQAGSVVIGTAAIASTQIISLDVAKLLAGSISTNKFTVQSDNGNLKILGDTIQLWDANGKERVSLGLNSGDYNLLVRGTDGTTVLFGTAGVTKAGITSGAVDDSKVDANANINGSKIEKESLVTQINGATTLVKSSHVKYDPTGQTLEVAFGALSTIVTSQGTTITSQTTSISTLQGQITTKVTQTDITNSIKAIQVGGRNLVVGSSIPTVGTQWTSDGWGGSLVGDAINKYYILKAIYGWHIARYDLGIANAGKTYTISFDAYLDSTVTTAPNHSLYIANTTSGTFASKTVLDGLTVDTWLHVSETVVLNSTGYLGFGTNCVPENSGYYTYWHIKNLKIETGNKATDWTPTPEDVQGQIDAATTRISTTEASIVTQAGQIVLKALATDLTTTNSNVTGVTSRMTAAEASLTINANNIALKVNSNGVIASINASTEGISISASKINLSGYATFTSLSTLGSTTINGGNIVAGTITADKINTTNLTVFKIISAGNANSYATMDTNPVAGISSALTLHDATNANFLSIGLGTNASSPMTILDAVSQIGIRLNGGALLFYAGSTSASMESPDMGAYISTINSIGAGSLIVMNAPGGLTINGQLSVSTQPAWITPTLLNGWVNVGGGYTPARYRKNSLGEVETEGTVYGGTIGSAIFVYSAGYRTSTIRSYVIENYGGTGLVKIVTDGSFIANVSNNSGMSMNIPPFNVN